ncbi:hypothetical protein AYO43_08465 [Nitrospira sp. SCGC AG-212-E16]|jgi:hypothetical protein|nr:hypothetical protein AYO43_08465 [Nitrospira sp. SCGC AG-212-E16]
MPFSIRPYRRFPVQCSVTYNAGPFLKLLTYFLGFGMLLTLLVSSGPACAEWMSLGTSDSGTTVYADLATMRREGDLVKMLVLFDFKTKQTKADVSFLSAKAQMEYDCAAQRFEGLAVTYFSGNMGNGNLLDRSSGKGKWIRVSPESLDQALWKLACDKK